ncbi:MAG: hypothetical protein ACXVDD_11675 [Polyangia bacterium]
MRGSRIIGIIALVATLAAILLAAALKHQQTERRARVHQIAR